MEFENEEEYEKYLNKIADAFYDEDLGKLSKLLNHRVTSQKQAENYLNDVWKKDVKLVSLKEKPKIRKRTK